MVQLVLKAEDQRTRGTNGVSSGLSPKAQEPGAPLCEDRSRWTA